MYKSDEKVLDLNDFISETDGNYKLKIEFYKNKIILRPIRNLSQNGRLPKPQTLNRFITINTEFLEVLGMYFGDGLKALSGSGNRQIYFSNTELDLQRKWLRFLNRFGIKRHQLHFNIQIGELNNYTEVNLSEAKSYWVKELKLLNDQLHKISIKKGKNSKVTGILTAAFYSKIFRGIFHNIYNFYLKNLLTEPKHIAPFLRGLFAAEGCVRITKSNIIHSLGISAGTPEKREFIRSLLKSVGINSVNNSQRRECQITGFFNFLKFKKLRLFVLHPDKAKKFIYGLNKMSYSVPGLTKFLIISELKKTPLTRYQLAEHLNRGVSGIYYNLKDLETKGMVKKRIVGKKFQGFDCFWVLKKYPNDLLDLTTQTYLKDA